MAITERYVSSSGTDTYANSTSSSTPCSLSTAITSGVAGDRFNIKADGTYTRSASDTLSAVATATSPIIWRGYTTTLGDATIGRGSGGVLDTSNMPTIAYNATFRLNNTGTDHIFESLIITANQSGAALLLGQNAIAYNCKVTNSSTNAAAVAIAVGARGGIIDCDATLDGASGGTAGITCAQASALTMGCLVTATAAPCITVGSSACITHNVCYGTTGDGISCATSSLCNVHNNTIYNCGGDGIDIAAGNTTIVKFVANHITNCGGYGINFNGATCEAVIIANRFRDNTSGNISGAADWTSGTNWRVVTTDTGGAETDFTNAASKDFSLVAGSPGIGGAPGYLTDIGAWGTPVVTSGLKSYSHA